MKYRPSEIIEELFSSFLSPFPEFIASSWLEGDSLLYKTISDGAEENLSIISEIFQGQTIPRLVFTRKRRGDSMHLGVGPKSKDNSAVYYSSDHKTVSISTNFFSRHNIEHGSSSIPDRKMKFDYVFFHEFGHATTFFDKGEYLRTNNSGFNFLFSTQERNIHRLHTYMERQLNEIYADVFSIACLCKKHEYTIIKEVLPQIVKNRWYSSHPFGVTEYGFEEHETAFALDPLQKKFNEATYLHLQKASLSGIQDFIGQLIEQSYPAVLGNNISGFYSVKETAIKLIEKIKEGDGGDKEKAQELAKATQFCEAVKRAQMEYSTLPALLQSINLNLPKEMVRVLNQLPGEPLPVILLAQNFAEKLQNFRAEKSRPSASNGPGQM